jgi:excisionase family DNA binding protein
MVTKAEIRRRIPAVRGLGEADAAGYLSLSTSTFREMVLNGSMPQPRRVGRRRIWDAEEIDRAFRELPREGEDETNTWEDYA